LFTDYKDYTWEEGKAYCESQGAEMLTLKNKYKYLETNGING
jgi:hypothetical protein